MALNIRTYSDLADPERSGVLDQVLAQRKRVTERLASVKRTVAVMSGKGGVGKSYVSAGLAGTFAQRGMAVGLLDADLNGPTAARLLDVPRTPLIVEEAGVRPAVGRHGVRVISMDLLLGDGAPLKWKEPSGDGYVWRGTLEAQALREFLADVQWGSLDLLVVDLPPGTQRLADLHELVPALSGVVAVTLPSEESREAVRRSLALARDLNLRVLGVVENMSGYLCPHCGAPGPLFEGDAADQLVREFGNQFPVLGRLPFNPPPGALIALATATLVELDSPRTTHHAPRT
jgi:ATP-binding protein involved in chromosome partitioning